MKRFLSILITITIITAFCSTFVFAEGNYIDGLEEKMNALWISADDYPEIIENMKITREEEIKESVRSCINGPKFMKDKVGFKGMTDEEIEATVRARYSELDYTKKIFRIHPTITERSVHALQYANANKLGYLISNQECLAVSEEDGGGKICFDTDGTIWNDPDRYSPVGNGYIFGFQIIFDDRVLNDIDGINNILAEHGETKVDDIKIVVSASYIALLWINCDGREYIIKLSDREKNAETAELYTYTEVKNGGFVTYSDGNKPLYEAEAEALQAEGLLNGNENGLDLLKPLTRIEAAAMLLRAMGKDEFVEANRAQTFVDLPSTHWGFGAAENAYSLGLVNGVGDDMFAPDDWVTDKQFATMVLRAAGNSDFDWEEAMQILIKKDIITHYDKFGMEDLFTRGDMAKIIYESRQKGLL